MNPWPVFLAMAAVTFATRYAGIAVAGRDLPDLLKRWVRYVPIAVLSALIAPDALAPQGELALGASTVALLAGLVVAWRTRNVFLTLAAGMATFWALKLLRLI